MYKLVILLLILNVCNSYKINLHLGIVGPWKQIETTNKEISSNIIKRGFVSKLFFEEDEEIDEDEQVTSIKNLAGLIELEMVNIGQTKLPKFKNLNLIKSMKFNNNQISHIDNASLSDITPKYLDLSYNQINTIDDGAFGDYLETINLQCNDLLTISSTWFKDPESLQNLRLSNNKIIIIPDNFNAFTNLKDIHLNANSLSIIQEGAFVQNRYTYMDLSYNDFTELDPNIFKAKNVEIMYLNIRANKLNYLSTDFMKKVNITIEITFDLNPILCPCYDIIRHEWLPRLVFANKKNSWLDAQAEDHAHREEPYCVKDRKNTKICIQKVDEDTTQFYFDYIEPFDVTGCDS